MSGKKGSGKNTLANFVTGLQLLRYGIVHKDFSVDGEGLWVSDIEGDVSFEGILDLYRQTDTMKQFIEYIAPAIRLYSFADSLKDISINILGLKWEQCYGSDDDKNSLTNLRWEDLFSEIRTKYSVENKQDGSKKKLPRSGFMTGREVLQVLGTDIFRRIYDNVWVDTTLRRIREDNSKFAIISDVRFPNEVKGIEDNGGKVIRLTRAVNSQDTHPSETALDNYEFQYVIDNANMDFEQQNKACFDMLCEWGWFVKENE